MYNVHLRFKLKHIHHMLKQYYTSWRISYVNSINMRAVIDFYMPTYPAVLVCRKKSSEHNCNSQTTLFSACCKA